MDRFWFTEEDGTNKISLNNISNISGVGLPPPMLNVARRGYNIDGSVVLGAKYDARPFTITFDERGSSARESAAKILNYFSNNVPKKFWSQHNDESSRYLYPVYINNNVEISAGASPFQRLNISFLAVDPWFHISTASTSVSFETPVFEFDVEIPAGGVEFSTATYSMAKNNNGVGVGDVIVRFVGGANSPEVTNQSTGEFISVKKEIQSTEILEINAYTGRVDVIDENGTRHNAFNYIDEDSDFIHLRPGENEISYNAGEGSAGIMEVSSIEYYPTI